MKAAATQDRDPWRDVEEWVIRTIPWILLASVLVPVIFLATTPLHRLPRADEKALIIGFALFFASIALVLIARLMRALDDGDHIGVESHWGGLGGGLGGWRISRPTAYLVCGVTFASLAVVVLASYRSPADEQKTTLTKTDNATTEKTTMVTTTTDKAPTAASDATPKSEAATKQTSTSQTTTVATIATDTTTLTKAKAPQP